MKIICAWCDRVVREGTLPASHSLCSTCAVRLNAELDESVIERSVPLHNSTVRAKHE